jgi:hypothetical protein
MGAAVAWPERGGERAAEVLMWGLLDVVDMSLARLVVTGVRLDGRTVSQQNVVEGVDGGLGHSRRAQPPKIDD